MEKAGRVNRDAGLFAIAIGAFVSQILVAAGIINLVQGVLVENYFKNRRLRKKTEGKKSMLDILSSKKVKFK